MYTPGSSGRVNPAFIAEFDLDENGAAAQLPTGRGILFVLALGVVRALRVSVKVEDGVHNVEKRLVRSVWWHRRHVWT
jgi:hypothetical protein